MESKNKESASDIGAKKFGGKKSGGIKRSKMGRTGDKNPQRTGFRSSSYREHLHNVVRASGSLIKTLMFF
ncbi:unnamed protein product [Calicophoron daubneyi]|uniref:Uncharacterized protein n=1 Tax=Calicophoron daubneyi TaxID=300641 RepID=A0AAV2TE65_CALDB